jgi:hypothetical protein
MSQRLIPKLEKKDINIIERKLEAEKEKNSLQRTRKISIH